MIVAELTQRALRDVKAIDRYSIHTFGERVADEYMADIQDAISVISENPGLLRTIPEISERLSFYRARRHLLVCVVFAERIYVSMVMHGQMDVSGRIAELEPQLIHEAEEMHQRIQRGGTGR